MEQTKSFHDAERDRIVSDWSKLGPFVCAACQTETEFPRLSDVRAEYRYKGLLRADVAAFDGEGRVAGVVEVVYSHPPTAEALSAQSTLGFAFYRWLRPTDQSRPDDWICSPECWTWYFALGGAATSSTWEAARCDSCEKYFHENNLSWFQFRDWNGDPHCVYCIYCAASFKNAQWRSPGELAAGDPRQWTPDDDTDPAGLLMAYCDASFWLMVWAGRVAKLDDPDTYRSSNNERAEDATARCLPLVFAAFDAGNWKAGADLLSPVGAPGWAAYPGEPERLLAFRTGNCRDTAEAWRRLEHYRLQQLPEELADIVRNGRGVPA